MAKPPRGLSFGYVGARGGMGVSTRAARSRELIANGRRPAIVARVLQVNRSGLYRRPTRRPKTARAPVVDPVDRLIVEVAPREP